MTVNAELPGSQGKKGNKMGYKVLKGGDRTVLQDKQLGFLVILVRGQRPFLEEQCNTTDNVSLKSTSTECKSACLAPRSPPWCLARSLAWPQACPATHSSRTHLSVQSGVLFSQWIPLKPVGQVHV